MVVSGHFSLELSALIDAVQSQPVFIVDPRVLAPKASCNPESARTYADLCSADTFPMIP